MNSVQIIGRLTKDPEVRYTAQNQQAIAHFSVAINRGKDSKGNDLGADYPNIVCFGKTAQLVEKYITKGRLIGIQGRIHTDSYEKDGKKIYTTEVVADRVEFLDKAPEGEKKTEAAPAQAPQTEQSQMSMDEDLSMFSKLTDDDIPF